jgi:hypothetical protein
MEATPPTGRIVAVQNKISAHAQITYEEKLRLAERIFSVSAKLELNVNSAGSTCHDSAADLRSAKRVYWRVSSMIQARVRWHPQRKPS